jgi:N-acetylglucosaminyl-diphospho-decaprenol L-rhamnosyltransferase
VIEQCLDGLAKMAATIQPIVVDNASGDRTVERARKRGGVEVIANARNRGFAGGVNQGVQATDTPFILLLNPDVTLLSPVDELIESAHKSGLACGKLTDASGHAQSGFTIRRFPTPASLIFELFGFNRLWPMNPVNKMYRYYDRSLDVPCEADQPAGAFLMIRRDVWEKLGGFDEDFHPVWFEDVDFCKRAADAGYRAQFVPAVVASHVGGHSVRTIPPGCRAVYWCVSLLRYAAKHFRPMAYRGICAAVALSSAPRMVAEMIRDRSFTPIRTYSSIIRIAGLCLVSSQRRGIAREVVS